VHVHCHGVWYVGSGKLDLHKLGLERVPNEVLLYAASITSLDLSEVAHLKYSRAYAHCHVDQ
jgi:hypothetical protein